MTPTMAPRLRATVSAVCRAEDLIAAIKAVTPHVGKEKDGGGVERVRVVADQPAAGGGRAGPPAGGRRPHRAGRRDGHDRGPGLHSPGAEGHHPGVQVHRH